jgi:uncharacterized membrane protein
MNTIFFTFIGIVVLISLAEFFVPNFSRPDNLFGVTVAPDTRERPEGRAIIRAWQLTTVIITLVVVGGMVAAAIWLPVTGSVFVQTGAILLLVGGELAQVVIFHGRAKAFAVPSAGVVRGAPLQASTVRQSVPWWWEILPLGIIAVTAIILVTNYAAAPAIIPIHWDANGQANGFADKSIGSYYQMVWTQLGLWVLLTALTATLRSTRIGNGTSAGTATMRLALARFLFLVKTAVLALLGGIAVITTINAVRGTPSTMIVLLLPFVLVIVLAIAVGVIFVRIGQSGWRVNRAAKPIPGDGTPDDKWIGGIVYFNRNDPALLVERRVGFGTTLNMAHPVSWVILLVLIGVPVGISLFVALRS